MSSYLLDTTLACRGLGPCGTRHASMGLSGNVFLAGREHEPRLADGVLGQWNFISRGVDLVRFNVELDEVGGSEACC